MAYIECALVPIPASAIKEIINQPSWFLNDNYKVKIQFLDVLSVIDIAFKIVRILMSFGGALVM